MIKVCHLTSVHSAKDGRIFKKQCCSLAKAGYEVYIIAPNAVSEEVKGVKIIGVPVRKEGRFYRMFCLTKAVYKKALEVDADIYHIHDPELMIYAAKLKRKGKKVIYDSHEDFPQQIKSKEYLPFFLRSILSFGVLMLEKNIFSRLDALISVSPNIVERLQKINSNTYQITNFPIISDVFDRIENEQLAICFTGQVSKLWMHENILLAISNIQHIEYILAGPVNNVFLEILEKNKGWNKVKYLGEVEHHQVKGILQQSKIGMALYDYSAEIGYNVGTLGNTKLFEYMQAGLPIICTDFILWKQVVEENKCGICVNPRDVNEISEAIKYLFDNPAIALEMGKNGQECVQKKYNWATQEQILLNLYQKLINDKMIS